MTQCEYAGCRNPATAELFIGGDKTPPTDPIPICPDCLAAAWKEIERNGIADRVNWVQSELGRHPFSKTRAGS